MTTIHSRITQDTQLHERLLRLAQKSLSAGEVFLLAKAISDRVRLPDAQCENVRLHTLTERAYIDSVIFALEGYAHVPTDAYETIYRLVDELVLWRHAVATGTSVCLFTGEAQNVVDDLTGILRYVNMSEICHVADMAASANHVYGLFKDVAALARA